MNFGSGLLLSLLYLTINAEFKFEPIDGNTPIIVNKLGRAHLTYDMFKMVYFADLAPFYRLRTNIKTAINTIKNVTTMLDKPIYTTAAGQLAHQLDLLYVDEETLDAYRTKRWVLCEFCGKINHFLYGVMDAETARQYDDVINGIGSEVKENRQLIRDQSEIFKTTLNFNKNTFARIESKLNELAASINNQTDEIRTIKLELTEQGLVQHTQMLMSEYYRIFGQIRRTLTDARNGKLTEIIPKKQLAMDLKDVDAKLGTDQTLPIDPLHEDAFHIFKYSELKATLFKHKLMIEVTVPITENEAYRLYKATPIPVEFNNINVISSVYSTYFLINTDMSKYVPMSQKQLDAGKLMVHGEMLYKPTATTLLTPKGICEWQVLRDAKPEDIRTACHFTPFLRPNVLITVMENELIFVNTQRNTSVFEACNGTEYVQRNVAGRGTIQLDAHCLFKTEHYLVRPHKTSGLEPSEIILPIAPMNELNLANLTTEIYAELQSAMGHISETTVIQDNEEMERLMDLNQGLIESASHEVRFKEIHYDSTTHSWFSGLASTATILGIIATIATMIFYKFNLFSCILRAIIKRSATAQLGDDGTLTLDLPEKLASRVNLNQSPQSQSNGQEKANDRDLPNQADNKGFDGA